MKKSANEERAAAAELALKAHLLQSTPAILAEISEGDMMLQEIAHSVDLTEAPEDAICSLMTDLLHYSEREKIDWTQDVMARALERFRSGRCRKAPTPSTDIGAPLTSSK